MGALSLFGRRQQQEPLMDGEGKGGRCVLGRSVATTAATATAIAPGCQREASETVHHHHHHSISSAVLPQRRPRPGAAGVLAEAGCGRASTMDASVAGDGCYGDGRGATRRRLAGRRWSGRASRGGSGLPCQPLARCSLAVLAFLSDPTAAFQVRCCALSLLPRRWCTMLGCRGVGQLDTRKRERVHVESFILLNSLFSLPYTTILRVEKKYTVRASEA